MTELFDQTVIDHEPSQQLAVADTPDPSMSPLALIRQAVELGLGPEQLKALVDLQEQVRASRAKEEFAAAMNACQEELPLIVKDANNSQTKSTYVRMETVQHLAKPVISKHGFSLSFGEADSPNPEMKRTICDVRHRAGHLEQYHLDLPLDGVGAKGNAIGAMNRVQAAVSTGTYAQRYLTCRIFNITIAETDRDGAQLHPNPEPNGNAPKAAPRGQRDRSEPVNQPQKPPPDATNDHGVRFDDVNQVISRWKTDNPSQKTNGNAFSDWATMVAEHPLTGKWGEWTPSDLAKCRDALGLISDKEIPW